MSATEDDARDPAEEAGAAEDAGAEEAAAEPGAGDGDSEVPRMSGGQKVLFWGLTLLVLALVLELVSFLSLSVLHRRAYTPATARAERRALLDQVVDVESPRQLRPMIHPFLGYVLEPGSGLFGFGERALPVTDYGFVDDGPPLHRRSPDTYLVAVTGGSVAQQISILGAEALRRELARDPEIAGREVELVRLASGGYKQPQQLMAVQYLLALGGELDMVINIDGFNEVALHFHENEPRGTHYAYPRLWHAMAGAADGETRRLFGKMAFYRDLQQRWLRLFDGSPVAWSMTGNLAWSLGHRLLGQRVTRAQRALSLAKGERRAFQGPPPAGGGEAEVYSRLIDLWRRSSIQMARLCRANGIRYHHFLQPNQYVAGSKPMGEEERRVAISESHGYRPWAEKGYPLLIAAGPELAEEVPFTDLTGLFEGVEEPVYSDGCCHFNARGCRLVAEAVGRAVADRPAG